MTERDPLFVRLEQVNPVPDPSRLYELRPHQPLPPPGSPGAVRSLGAARAPGRRRFMTPVAAAIVVVLAGVAFGMLLPQPDQAVSGDRTLHLTIDESDCRYHGPTTLTAGESRIVYTNASPTVRWANTLRLDEDRTAADIRAHIAADPLADAPPWSSPVWLALGVPVGDAPASRTVHLEPGTHVLLCGDATRGAILGAEVLVTAAR